MGLDTCVGQDIQTFWSAISCGNSGIKPITSFDSSEYPCKVAGEVNFDPKAILTDKEIRRTSRFQQMLFSSVKKAVDHRGGIDDHERRALLVGTGGGGMPLLESQMRLVRSGRWRAGDRLSLPKALPNMAAAFAAQKLGINGPTLTISTACASSTDALGLALHMIRWGQVSLAIVGGVDTWVTPASIAGFCLLHALSTRSPEDAARASRPFDLNRDGLVPSEGAGAIVLESLDAAEHRGAAIYGELAGAGSTCDALHMLAPRQDAVPAAQAILDAVADSGLVPMDIDHVNAHGTSTKLNDIVETRALKLALGDRAHQIPITSTKSVIGHASGACGVIESIATILSIQHQFVPPTINLTDSDPECDLDYTPLKGRQAAMQVALKVNFGFGGQNSALVFRHYPT
jgi:3-oxoacyl-[acyl-carrier-protein] synthase II